MNTRKRTGQLLSSAALASLIVMTPYVPTFDADGHLRLEPAYAFAKSGKGSDGNGGDDDHDSNSGSGSGGDSDDNSGSGKGGHDDDDDDDDDDDGSSRSGRGGDKKDRSQSGGQSSGSAGITKVETSASGIEVRYADGTKEEIENGRYERKNAQNRTIEERPATGADVSRLRSLANGISIDSVRSPGQSGGAGSNPAKIEIQGNNIEVSYANGWKEEIEGGRYELKDPFNRTVVERTATAADRSRLQAIAN